MSSPANQKPPAIRASTARLSGGTRYIIAFLAALFLLPSAVVPAGPLRSNGSPAVVLAVGAFVLLTVTFLSGRRQGVTESPGADALIFSSLLFLITWANGQTRPLDALVAASTLRAGITLVAYTGIGLLAVHAVRTERERFAVVVTAVLGLIYNGLIGLLQGFAARDYRYLLRPPGFVLNRDFAPQVRGGFVRVFGTSDSPIEFAVLMACLLALSGYVLKRSRTAATRVIGVAGVLVGAVGLPSSVSRTGAVCLAVVFLVYAFTLSLRMLAVLVAAFAGLILTFALISPKLFDEIVNLFANASSDTSITSRTDDYSVVGQAFAGRPWLGAGLGSSPPAAFRYLDNQWLQAVVQGGIVGLIATTVAFGAAFVAAGVLIARHRRANSMGRAEAVAYLAVFGAIFASSFTFDLFSFPQAKYLFFVVFGLAWSAYRELSPDRAVGARRGPEPAAAHQLQTSELGGLT